MMFFTHIIFSQIFSSYVTPHNCFASILLDFDRSERALIRPRLGRLHNSGVKTHEIFVLFAMEKDSRMCLQLDDARTVRAFEAFDRFR